MADGIEFGVQRVKQATILTCLAKTEKFDRKYSA
jgi:hypothetical protein